MLNYGTHGSKGDPVDRCSPPYFNSINFLPLV